MPVGLGMLGPCALDAECNSVATSATISRHQESKHAKNAANSYVPLVIQVSGVPERASALGRALLATNTTRTETCLVVGSLMITKMA